MLTATCKKVLLALAVVAMLTGMNDNATKVHGASLWTTPVAAAGEPLREAAIDTTVSAYTLRHAVDDVRQRATVFTHPITEALLRKSV